MGRLPIDVKALNMDFVVGHKSMAASGPIGVIGMKEEYVESVLKLSKRHAVKRLRCLDVQVEVHQLQL